MFDFVDCLTLGKVRPVITRYSVFLFFSTFNKLLSPSMLQFIIVIGKEFIPGVWAGAQTEPQRSSKPDLVAAT